MSHAAPAPTVRRSRVVRIVPKEIDDLPEPIWAPASPAAAPAPAPISVAAPAPVAASQPGELARLQLVKRSVALPSVVETFRPAAQAPLDPRAEPPELAPPMQANTPADTGVALRFQSPPPAMPIAAVVAAPIAKPPTPPPMPAPAHVARPPTPPPMPIAEAAPVAEPAAPVVPMAQAPTPERRTQARRLVEFEVSLDSPSNFYAGFAQDLSDGGIFVAIEPLPEVGEAIELAFELEGKTLKATAVVRWVRDPLSCGVGVEPGAGLRFVGLHPRYRARIAEFMSTRDPLFYLD